MEQNKQTRINPSKINFQQHCLGNSQDKEFFYKQIALKKKCGYLHAKKKNDLYFNPSQKLIQNGSATATAKSLQLCLTLWITDSYKI